MEELGISDSSTIDAPLIAQLGASDTIMGLGSGVIEEGQWDNLRSEEDDNWSGVWSQQDSEEEISDFEEDEPDLSEIEPVRAFIPLDIWLEIFSVSEPEWLARARRVSQTFKSLIDNDNIWKRARRYWHPKYPEPMFGFTEMQMWSFHRGLDCTACGTKKGKIITYWQFRSRFCTKCAKKLLIQKRRLEIRSGFKIEWMEYFVSIALKCSPYNSSVYYLNDIESFEEKMKTPKGRDWFENNKETLKEGVLNSLSELRRLNAFEKLLSAEERRRVDTMRETRDRDIRKRCSFLSPPLGGRVLHRITAYSLALKGIRPLTDRSWETLREKLEGGREMVEEAIRAEEAEEVRQQKVKEEIIVKLQGFTDIWEPAKARLADYIDEFLAENGGTVMEGFEGSFAIQALQYARKKWHETEENSTSQLPLGMIKYLVKTKLIDICNGKRHLFSCKLCPKDRLFSSVGGLFDHLLSIRHKRDERLKGMIKPIDGLPINMLEFPCVEELAKNSFRTQWLEDLPIYAPGPIFKPLVEQSFSSFNPREQAYPPTKNTPAEIPTIDSSPLSSGRVRVIMERELVRTNDCQIPMEICLYLWFRLSISSYTREYNTLPTVVDFVGVARSVRQGDSFDRGVLRCGLCNLQFNSPFGWGALGEHFAGVHRKSLDKWPEKLVKMPTASDICYAMGGVNCETAQTWTEFLRAADEYLAEEVLSLRVQNGYTV